MNVRLTAIDEEIQQLEERIASDRAAFVSALSACGHSVRETASSPKALLAVAALGFVAGKLIFRSRGKGAPAAERRASAQPSKIGGLLGLLASGLTLMQPSSGVGGLARWAAHQLWERRKQKEAAAGATRRAAWVKTTPRGSADTATPQVRMPPRRSAAQSTATNVR